MFLHTVPPTVPNILGHQLRNRCFVGDLSLFHPHLIIQSLQIIIIDCVRLKMRSNAKRFHMFDDTTNKLTHRRYIMQSTTNLAGANKDESPKTHEYSQMIDNLLIQAGGIQSSDNRQSEMEADQRSDLDPEGRIKIGSMAQNGPDRAPKPQHLRLLLPKGNALATRRDNPLRPCYDGRNWSIQHNGIVAWWDNKTGKGLVIEDGNNVEHRICLDDISPWGYGALIPGTMVEYEYHGGFDKFWVQRGCEYVLYVSPLYFCARARIMSLPI